MSKSVALVVNSFDKGGLEQVVLNLYLGYKQKGWNAYILSQSRHVGSMAEKLLDLRDIYIFDNSKEEFIKFCRSHGINVLHYHYNTFMMDDAKKMGIKALYTMHNVYTWMNLPEIREYSVKLAAAHMIVPVSSFVERYYLARTGASNINIQTIINGVDFSELDGKFDDFNCSRDNLGLANRDIVVAAIASFHPSKHQIGMIGIMEKLNKNHPEIKLLLVGNQGDIDYYNYFIKVLAGSSAKESIVMIPYFDHKYMGQFLRETVDIFTLPSLYEGCSNAVLEAAYCAKPMVLTDVGNADDIKDITSCEVVQAAYEDLAGLSPDDLLDISLRKRSRNTDELVNAISKVASGLGEYNAKAANTVSMIGQYSTERMVEQYVTVIESL